MDKTDRLPDPELLQTFLAVADSRSFTAAARRLGTRQSTVSQQVSRLEAQLDCRLFMRDTHSVALTVQGATLIPFAREVLTASARLKSAFAGRTLRGLVRLGISEDFALSGLSAVLADFRARHAEVELALVIGLSGLLREQFDAGALDVIFAKKGRDDPRGQRVWREELAWVGPADVRPDPDQPVPLIMYPPPSITRAQALDALEAAGRAWKIVCTSSSLSGLRAAALAGLGFVPHSRRLLPAGLSVVPPAAGLPPLGDIEFVVLGRADADHPAHALMTALFESAGRLNAPPAR
ncbi:LysR family transcriptional regulator [Verticiella sediminum]|uniref:LysR family transcriptional regulator n=1 Tax=Verticiella sediminum TaxID=1247510 RepID=A0A556B0U6_9BURK|nr:LysR family transcriptional regulator [Verticiella sediminum]TSH98806.1 LysR family transcriptional regulator [Verticiella sediminum]